MAYAVIKVGGKQYRVEKGDSLVVDRLSASEGDKLTLDPLLFADSKNTVFDRGELEKVKVEARVTGHERGPKLHVLKFKPKIGYKRRTGHRSELTRIEIADIRLLQRKSSTVKEAKEAEETPKPEAKPRAKPRASAASGSAEAKPARGKAQARPKAQPAKPRSRAAARKKETDDGS